MAKIFKPGEAVIVPDYEALHAARPLLCDGCSSDSDAAGVTTPYTVAYIDGDAECPVWYCDDCSALAGTNFTGIISSILSITRVEE